MLLAAKVLAAKVASVEVVACYGVEGVHLHVKQQALRSLFPSLAPSPLLQIASGSRIISDVVALAHKSKHQKPCREQWQVQRVTRPGSVRLVVEGFQS